MELPYIPADVPFTGEQKAWFAGFLAGMGSRIALPGAPAAQAAGPGLPAPAGPGSLLVVYGTQTGNAELVAEQAVDAAAGLGLNVTLADMADITLDRVAAAGRVLVVVSTYGEGDMPAGAEDLWAQLAAPAAPRLEGLSYAVCGLGDSIYDGFCQAAKNFDARLAELGAERVAERVECDVDFSRPADAWLPGALAALAAAETEASAPAGAAAAPAAPAAPGWGRKNPYPATILANSVLSGPTSAKEVRHLVVSLGDSGIEHEPGDGLSVVPVNDDALVQRLLDRIGATGDEPVTDRKHRYTLREALTHRYEISAPSKYLVDYVAARTAGSGSGASGPQVTGTGSGASGPGISGAGGGPGLAVDELAHLVATGDQESLDAWLWGRDVLDVLNVDPALTITPEELIAELRPLAPRVYSISSSPRAHNGTVHLTMATVRYRSGDRDRGGVCSTYLADRLAEGDAVRVFVTPNNAFRLPADDVPVIMVGPGTGIAPFRSFLHERAERGATGDNWLFFGDQHRDADFLYEAELAQLRSDAVLTRLDLAFSRDQDHKVYVQDRMREQGLRLYRWLERGASLFVCGDATRMAHDVDVALHEIVAEHGGLGEHDAAHYVNELKNDKRYLRDVY